MTSNWPLSGLRRTYDGAGFGGAPKFPPSMVLEWLLRHHARTQRRDVTRAGARDDRSHGPRRHLRPARRRLRALQRRCHVGRPALREDVVRQRFAASRLHPRVACYRLEPWRERVVEETADFLLRDLRTTEGGFASALDADTDGVEGATYVWTPAQLTEVLGTEDGAWAAALFTVTDTGTFEHGASTLQLLRDPDDWDRLAVRPGPTVRATRANGRSRRGTTRSSPRGTGSRSRPWPRLERSSSSRSGSTRRAAVHELLLDVHRTERTTRTGLPTMVSPGRHAGVLEDYGDLAEGLLALYVGDRGHRLAEGRRRAARRRARALRRRRRRLLRHGRRRRGAASSAAGPDRQRHALGAGRRRRGAAVLRRPHRIATRIVRPRRRLSAVYAQLGPSHARFAGWGLAVAEALLDGPREVAVVGARWRRRRRSRCGVRRCARPRRDSCSRSVTRLHRPASPLLADRPLVDGWPAAYVCRASSASDPSPTEQELERLLL